MNNCKLLCGLLMLTVLTSCSARDQVRAPERLRCQYMDHPLGLSTDAPFFSWWMVSDQEDHYQSAYQIVVGLDSARLVRGEDLLWDSGKKSSGHAIQALYEGPALSPVTRYYWKVRIWDQNGNFSEYSDVHWWETGPDWTADWISDNSTPFEQPQTYFEDHPSPLLRKSFDLKDTPTEARLFISGLGYYESFVNGQKIGSSVLDPGWTNYGKRTLYSSYDLTGQLQQGANVMSVMLGNGWYNPMPIRHFGRWNLREILTVGQPKVIAELHLTYADGSKEVIPTDNTWKHGDSWILYNDVYLGERQDGRLKDEAWNHVSFDDSDWASCHVVDAPSGRLIPQQQPPIRITDTVEAVSVRDLPDGSQLVDLGQNFAGWIHMKVQGEAGQEIKLRYGELLYPDGSLNGMTAVTTQIKKGGINGGPGVPETAFQEDIYITGGLDNEFFQHHFTFHGFRYVQIWDYPGTINKEDIYGLRLNSDLVKDGEFNCSNEDFNRIQEITEWTFLSNVFSIESDCPAREKFGYGGDMVTAGEAYIFNYDMANFYRKTIRDFADDARPGGGMTECAPFNGIDDRGLGDETGPVGWQLAYPYLQELLYRFYGDIDILREQYPHTQRLIEFLEKSAPDHLIDVGLSDHNLLNEKPITLTSSLFYYHMVRCAKNIAGALEEFEDVEYYDQLSRKIKTTILDQLYDQSTGCFANCNQTAQSVGLWYDILDEGQQEKAMARLADSIERRDGHLSTGIFGTKMMLDVFRKNNTSDLAYTLTNQPDYPGWRNMLANGATTLWESWRGGTNGPSHNHPMFGSISEWFYRSVLGINPAEDAVACHKWIISPKLTEQIKSASGTYQSVRGVVRSDYTRDSDQLIWKVEIPANTSAVLEIPTHGFENPVISVNGQKLNTEIDAEYHQLEIGNGIYEIMVHPSNQE